MIQIRIVEDGFGNVGWEIVGEATLGQIFATCITAMKSMMKDIMLKHAQPGCTNEQCELERDILQVLVVLKKIEDGHNQSKGGENDMDDEQHLNTEPTASDAQAPVAEPAAEPQAEQPAEQPQAEPAADEPADAGEKADEPTSGQEAGQE